MNTTAKGDVFEEYVFKRLQALLAMDELPINSKHSQIYRKRKYYSKDRDANVIVDIAIECKLPDEPKPNMYVIIECKNYKKSVPVNDIEEFYAKVQQITGVNVKAYFYCTSAVQKATLTFAIAKGIRIVRVNGDGNEEVLAYRREKGSGMNASKMYINAFNALINDYSITPPFVAISPHGAFFSLEELFLEDFSKMD